VRRAKVCVRVREGRQPAQSLLSAVAVTGAGEVPNEAPPFQDPHAQVRSPKSQNTCCSPRNP
jgi:hypothetical protein